MKYVAWLLALAPLSAGALACFDSTIDVPDAAPTGLPCDVAQALSVCQACHGPTLAASAPFSLVSYGDLTQVSPQYSDQTVAQRVVARMGDANVPMPPHPLDPSPQSDIDTIQAWIDAGYPSGTCAPPAGGTNPFDTPTVCTSGKNGTNSGSQSMKPGETCVSCHESNFGPTLSVAGTVYPTAHEPNDCAGVNVAGATVILTDSNNKVLKIPVNTVGNFYSQISIAPPYTVRLTYQNRERDMTGLVSTPTDGDCNTCHTADGTNGAPGRIMLP